MTEIYIDSLNLLIACLFILILIQITILKWCRITEYYRRDFLLKAIALINHQS
ncbi:MAG TPA: hypothetical protein V6C71_21155 [Coleofasciculaceae cyanobacterium]